MESEDKIKLRELLLSYNFTIGGLETMHKNRMYDIEEYMKKYQETTDSVIERILKITNK